jgi:TRAP-type C4-dicarboxylate transport system substrate-binding protein
MHSAKRLFGIAFALALTAVLHPSVAQISQPQFVMKLAEPAVNDNEYEWMKRFTAAIEAKSAGRIKTELYPGSQLGSIPRMIEATQLGSIQVVLSPPEFFSGIDPRFELLSAAGLFESQDHAVRTAADPEFSKAFLALGSNKGLIGAGLIISGSADFAMRKPFHTLADLEGKKIRVLASAFQMQQIARLGATGVPLSLADVLPALQQGTIDGALGSLSTFSGLGYYDAAKYVTEPGQAYIFVLVAISRRWFDTLPPDLQAMVMTTAQQTGAGLTTWIQDWQAQQRKLWVDKGGEIEVLSPADKAAILAKTATVADDIVKTKPELQPLWDILRAAAQRNR